MGRDLAKALRLLQKLQKDLHTAMEILEKVASEQGNKPVSQRRRTTAPLPEDPEVWQKKWRELEAAFEEQGADAVDAFVGNHKRDFLLQFLRHNHIPISGGGRPSKRQIAEELVQRLREQRALKRRAFTRSPRNLQNED